MKRGISFFLAVVFSLSMGISTAADQLNDARSKLNDANKSIADKKEKIKDIENTQKDTKAQINSLDSKMDEVSGEIDKLIINMSSTSDEIDKLSANIDKKVAEVDNQQVLLGKRLRAMYKSGFAGYLSIVLGSRDFTDLVDRVVLVERVVSLDKQLIESLENNKKMLVEKKQELVVKKASLADMQQSSAQKLSVLNQQSDEKKDYMSKLEKDKNEYKKMLDQEASEASQLTGTIKNLEAALAKKAKNNGGTKVVSNGKLYCITGKPYPVTSSYGNRYHPILHVYKFHSGIDIGVNFGTALYALKDGEVIYSGAMSGYGKVVMIDHGDIISLYAHLSSTAVSNGSKVKGGQLIAYSGNSGLSTGPHLHFEIRKLSGETINPINYYVK